MMTLRHWRAVRNLVLLWLVVVTSAPTGLRAQSQPYPAIDELLPKVIERAKRSRKSPAGYDFTRVKTTTHYDSDHEVIKQEERVYRITEKNGKPKAELLSKNGEPPPVRSPKAESTEPKPRTRSPGGDRSHGNDSLLHQINDDMVKRFQFSITNREVLQGRSTWVIEVRPRKDLKISSTEEEVLARVAGKIWVDEEEHEVVQAHVSLQETLKIGWGGMLGALRELRFSVTRSRIAAGVWVNSDTDLWLHFRQLFSAKRIEVTEKVTNVTPTGLQIPIPEAKPAPPAPDEHR
jgi:hypothetical protein